MQDNDFLGFTFNGVHFTIFPHPSETASNVIQLTRVSEGDRYTDNLLPAGQDITADVPGGDGTYYFGTNFKYTQFNIDFAFDNLSESDIRKIRQVFSKRNSLAPLIFDEDPYKYWMVKCQGMPTLKTICFVKDEELGDVHLIHTTDLMAAITSNEWPSYAQIGNRVYKGEGQVSFISYYPYARCGSHGTSKWLNNYSTTWSSDKIFAPTKAQWSAAAGLLPSNYVNSNYSYDVPNGLTVHTYNPGDVAADFNIILAVDSGNAVGNSKLLTIQNAGSSSVDYIIAVSSMGDLVSAAVSNGDTYFQYNSRTELLEGCTSSGSTTGHLYNRFINPQSTLFKISTGDHLITANKPIQEIQYDYIYY